MRGGIIVFYLLTVIVKTLPVGINYAVWAGMGFIITGVIIINLFSKSVTH